MLLLLKRIAKPKSQVGEQSSVLSMISDSASILTKPVLGTSTDSIYGNNTQI
jgi:hypothetical protein